MTEKDSALAVALESPRFKRGGRMRERAEQRLAERFVPQAPDERYREGVLDRLARRDAASWLAIICHRKMAFEFSSGRWQGSGPSMLEGNRTRGLGAGDR
jgi:hypothetical protein